MKQPGCYEAEKTWEVLGRQPHHLYGPGQLSPWEAERQASLYFWRVGKGY